MSVDSQHHNIVAIEAVHCPIPAFDLPKPQNYTLTQHQWTSQSELAPRIKDATIIITTTIPLTSNELSAELTPHLRLIVVMATGTDCVDKEAARSRGIPVCNCPGTNVESVSEHAIGLYFATRRKIVQLHCATTAVPDSPGQDTEWKTTGSLHRRLRSKDGHAPVLCGRETLGVIGYGALGQRIAKVGEALGMRVLIAERKGGQQQQQPREGRTTFEEVLREVTVVILCLPRNPETVDLISEDELKTMRPQALLINVARGGIVNEGALLKALKQGWIEGAATDVFAKEPAGRGDSPLLSAEAQGLNLVLTPHLAWLSEDTLVNLQDAVKYTIERWCRGETVNEIAR
ncbi:D-isomer specific 2-hydroxyacid dehydrogenase family protein [Aspergillus affinis]|uniref:D-isomer specific 2-hydroxyacid dehydrogenase family protein n=1 Tax=Aspergillus affinis TaxID=1070780 RepID=UPI0022FEF53D|nr:uncharacterized protein KD926_003830 [Aspergillus affinis]KAI9043300.1 hypothetical protein KD926_003830 [Aspergillus affinis]